MTILYDTSIETNETMSALTPDAVTTAVQIPTFYQNQQQFLKMLMFLFQDYQGQKVWQYLPPDTVRKICEQLHMLMEATEEYAVIQNNRTLLYNVYCVIISKVRGLKTNSHFHRDETPTFMTALYQLYKTLLHLKMPMPLFGHLQKGQ